MHRAVLPERRRSLCPDVRDAVRDKLRAVYGRHELHVQRSVPVAVLDLRDVIRVQPGLRLCMVEQIGSAEVYCRVQFCVIDRVPITGVLHVLSSATVREEVPGPADCSELHCAT